MKQKKIFLNSEFDRIWKKIEKGENITFLRYADGERAVMTGQVIDGVDGWVSPSDVSKLGKDLLTSLEINDARVSSAVSAEREEALKNNIPTKISNIILKFLRLIFFSFLGRLLTSISTD